MKTKKKISLDYHEGLSKNQAKIILTEVGLKYAEFAKWLDGQTCPVILRYNDKGEVKSVVGCYEYDLFRWIGAKSHGRLLIWD